MCETDADLWNLLGRGKGSSWLLTCMSLVVDMYVRTRGCVCWRWTCRRTDCVSRPCRLGRWCVEGGARMGVHCGSSGQKERATYAPRWSVCVANGRAGRWTRRRCGRRGRGGRPRSVYSQGTGEGRWRSTTSPSYHTATPRYRAGCRSAYSQGIGKGRWWGRRSATSHQLSFYCNTYIHRAGWWVSLQPGDR